MYTNHGPLGFRMPNSVSNTGSSSTTTYLFVTAPSRIIGFRPKCSGTVPTNCKLTRSTTITPSCFGFYIIYNTEYQLPLVERATECTEMGLHARRTPTAYGSEVMLDSIGSPPCQNAYSCPLYYSMFVFAMQRRYFCSAILRLSVPISSSTSPLYRHIAIMHSLFDRCCYISCRRSAASKCV